MLRTWLSLALVTVALLVCARGAAAQAPADGSRPWHPQIAIVWPHDGRGGATPVASSRLVNVSVWPRNQVECDAAAPYRLLRAAGSEPAAEVAGPQEIVYRRVAGGTFPSLEFNDVPASIADNPRARYAFVAYGEEQPTRLTFAGNVWVHAADPRTILPEPARPTGKSATPHPGAYDARIQIVFPHDAQGRPAGVAEATLVNVAVEVFAHGTLQAAVPDAAGQYPFSLALLVAEGNGPLQRAAVQPELTTYDLGGESYPRWVFNNVPVTPGHQTHLLVELLPAGGKAASPYTTIWTHAADGRTLLPEPTPPPACAPSPQAVKGSAPRIAYVRTTCEGAAPSSCYGGLFVLDPDTGEATNLTPHSPATYASPAYSPDGRWIAFLSDRDATRTSMALHVVRADGGGLRRISERYSQTYGPVYWSRDGRRLALRYPGDARFHVYTLEGQGPERLDTLPPEEWLWPNDSPDGRWRAVPCGGAAEQPLTGDWCLQPLAGSAENPFAMAAANDDRVAWSPDGERVALSREGRLHIVGRDGAGLVDLGEGRSPSWQPRPAGG